jgi:hypothetical protein
MSTIIKITHAGEIRRISTTESARGCTFSSFTATVKTLFPKLAGQPIALIWQDEEGDAIVVSSEIEFQEAIRYMTSVGQLLRFEVKVVSEDVPAGSAAASTAIHEHITCDECGMSPIKGIRYKCTVRNDYDLCSGCEVKKQQPYPVIKIFDPAHHPAALFYAFNDPHAPPAGGFHGRHWRRGCRPPFPGQEGSPRCPAMNGQQPGQAPPAAGPGPHGPGPRHCGRPRWGRHFSEQLLGKSLQEAVAPFVEAFDQVVGGLDLPTCESDLDKQQPDEAAKKTSEAQTAPAADGQVVSLEEQMLSAALEESMSLTTNSSAAPVEAKTLSTPSASAVEGEDWDVVRSGSPSLPTASAAVTAPAPAVVEVAAVTVEAAPATPAPQPSVASATVTPLQLLWRRELELLADMGFTDAEAALPLLQRHLVTPLALSGDRNSAPSVEGMQRVVSNLLGF